MIRNLTASAALLLTVACASGPMTSSSTNTPATGTATISQTAANAPDYVLLSEPSAVREWNAIEPEYALHVRGTMTNRGFIPVGGVQGRGKLCTDGQDWLSLNDLKIHKASEGVAPTAPYIKGCVNGRSFTPASREVVTQ